MSSKANSQWTPVHWPREITKAKKQWKMEGKSEIWTKLGKFGQIWTRHKIRKMGKRGKKNKKREKNSN